ncbi:MAG: PEP-CTERM sorting domain-containing protein [Akkermansiaceae bacterium]
MRKVSLQTTFLIIGSSISASAAVYTGASGGDFAAGANWDTGYPTTGDFGALNTESNLNSAAPNNIRAIRLGEGGGDTGILNVGVGGSLTATTSSNWDSHIGGSGIGVVNVNGGIVNLNFAEVGRNSGSTGTINLTSGTFNIARGSRENSDSWSIHVGSNDNDSAAGSGNITISGGIFTTRAGVELGNQDSASVGSGSFNVIGSTANINIGNSSSTVDGNWYQGSGYVLSSTLDAGGISKILISDDGTVGGVDVTFDSGSLLDLGFLASPVPGTWSILEAENTDIVDNGLALAAGVDSGWSFAVDNSGTNGILTATYIPEPSVGLLMGLASFSLLLRRRK